jgi:hypothetical protein
MLVDLRTMSMGIVVCTIPFAAKEFFGTKQSNNGGTIANVGFAHIHRQSSRY